MRARLTVLFTLGAAAALGVCLILLFVALDRQLAAALDADLRSRGGDLANAVRAGDIAVVARDPMAQLYTADGALLAGSPTLGDRRLMSVDEVRRLTIDTIDTVEPGPLPSTGDGAAPPVRRLAERVDTGRVLSVGVSEAPLNGARHRLLVVLLVAAPIVLAGLATGAWLVLRAALRPVDALTREAAVISSLEADRRLPQVQGDDEIARLAQTLDGMLARLRLAFERERAFVDDASHELRGPIAVLRGEIELALGAEGDADEVERSLRAAAGEAERLSRLAEDLLVLARQRAGSLVMRTEPVDLLDVAAAERDRLAAVLGLRIRVLGDPVVVPGDPDRLRQVLANLMHNSAAARAANLQVDISRDGAFAVLEVADDGPGFPPGLENAAFERFVRGDHARTPRGSGAGLGLPIVRAVVTAHGGVVDARNGEPLGGAVVTAHLPAG